MCRSLGIDLIAHKPHNARATGQVEKARDIIERKLEPGLKFRPVHSLEELNALAAKWRSHFNATAVHSRHGKTRTDIWLKITAEQLKKRLPLRYVVNWLWRHQNSAKSRQNFVSRSGALNLTYQRYRAYWLVKTDDYP